MKTRFLIIAFIFLSASVFQAGAATLKLASLLPEGTEWNKSLLEMAAEWKEITDGRFKIKIYPGGIAGGESDVIRKMRIGQIDMAVLTTAGITAILPDAFALSMPFMLESEEELDFIVDEASRIFDDSFLDKGFVMLTWSKSGWINFFSKEKVINPEEMMDMKFAGSVTMPEFGNLFRKIGFNVISIDTPDMLMGLQSGMVEAFYAPTMAAASYQWFGIANNMLDIKVAPMLGGIVISERAWKRIPDKYKEELLKSADELSKHFYREAVKLEEEAVSVMLKNGLRIHAADNLAKENWRALLGSDFNIIVGEEGFVSSESFNQVYSMLEEFRSR